MMFAVKKIFAVIDSISSAGLHVITKCDDWSQ